MEKLIDIETQTKKWNEIKSRILNDIDITMNNGNVDIETLELMKRMLISSRVKEGEQNEEQEKEELETF